MQVDFEPIVDVKVCRTTIEDRPGMATFQVRSRAQVKHFILVPEDFQWDQSQTD